MEGPSRHEGLQPIADPSAMDRARKLAQLQQAERHVAEGKKHVAKQEALVAALERDGHDAYAAKAREILAVLRDTQARHEQHRQSILDELAQS